MSRGVVAKRAVGSLAVIEGALIMLVGGTEVPLPDWVVTVTAVILVAIVAVTIGAVAIMLGRGSANAIDRAVAQRTRAEVRRAAATGWDQALAQIPPDGVSPAMDGLDWRKWMQHQLILCIAGPHDPVPDALLLPPPPPPRLPQPGDRIGPRTYVTEIGAKTSGLPYQMVRLDNGTTAWFTFHQEWDEEERSS